MQKTTTSPSEIMLTDRTSIETDWLCGMKYWWYKHEGGIGIAPAVEQSYFLLGRQIHDDFGSVAEGVPYQDVIQTIAPPETGDQLAWETHYRRLGWVVAFGKYIWPRWKKDYEVVKVEGEMILDRSPLWVAFTPDLVLRGINKSLDTYGKLVYKEYKTTKMKSPSWVAHWDAAVQMHISLMGLQEELNEPVAFAHVVGLDKGYEKDGRLNHPYVWAYRTDAGDWLPKYKWGVPHAPVWEYEDGIEKWVDFCGEDVVNNQFITSAPIFLDPRLLESLIRRRIEREKEIREWKEASGKDWAVREQHFEQRFNQCRPAIGSECPFYAACKNFTVQQDPLGSGLYVPRVPHHEVEILGVEGE
jgi:hypothetical protein